MTVGELIIKLGSIGLDYNVVVEGHEGGLDDAAIVSLLAIRPNPELPAYLGKYERCLQSSAAGELVVLVSRINRG